MDDAPTFAEIADCLLELVWHEQALDAIAAPFMRHLPPAPGVTDAYARLQRRMALIAQAQRLFAAMAPREAEHRALLAPNLKPNLEPNSE